MCHRSALAALLLAAGCAIGPSRTGLLIPLYVPPGPAWEALARSKAAHPAVPMIAVVNPASGPGAVVAAGYPEAIRALQSRGIRVIGYVATGYGRRPPGKVEKEIDLWRGGYGVDGIFFDEMSTDPRLRDHYAGLDAHARSRGARLTAGNPGAQTSAVYAGVVDILVLYEGEGTPALPLPGGWPAWLDPGSISILAHGVRTIDRKFLDGARGRVGYLYLTDDRLPNPWDSLPSYFPELASALD